MVAGNNRSNMVDSRKYNRMLLYAAGQMKNNDHAGLIELLTASGFIGEGFQKHGLSQDYLVGSSFLDLVTFLGCSPNVPLTPEEDTGQGFCFVRIHAFDTMPKLYSASNSVAPHCKRCNQTRSDWYEGLESGGEGGLCALCTRVDLIELLNWRKRAALTQRAIEVMNIYPHEAVPSPGLIERLENASGVNWAHAYLQADRYD